MKREDMALEKVVKQPPKPESNAAENGKPPVVHYASDAEFKKAHRRTGKLHAGLFRRLAE
jgi:hypothetical protein